MSWRLAKSLDTLRMQVNIAAPKRSKSSDGTIGDTAHSARASDHNPDQRGIVCALDITHDPKGGMDAGKLARGLVGSKDPRIKYIIWERQICAGPAGPKPWKWRKYTGSNPHTKHVHISVRNESAYSDSTMPWDILAPSPTKTVTQSKITKTAGTIAGVEAVDVATQVPDIVDKVGNAKQTADNAGITEQIITMFANVPIRFWIGCAVILGCAAIGYWYYREHGKGRA